MYTNRPHVSAVAQRRTSHTRLASLAALIALTITFMLAGITSASAHDKLLESNPADGSTLDASPTQIVLTFNNEVSSLGGQIIVKDAAGSEVLNTPVTTQGTSALVELADPLVNGAYTVAWRVVSSDAHPITGDFTFTVADPSATATEEPAQTEEPTQTEEPAQTEEPTQTETTDAETTGTGTEGADTSATQEDGNSLDLNWGRLAIFGGLGALAGAVVVLVNRARAKKNTGSGSDINKSADTK